jgi:hypothetical protein
MEDSGIKEQEVGNHSIMIDGQPIGNGSDNEQVCISQ